MRKYNWKKIVVSTVWVLAGIGAIVLLGAAMQKKNQKACSEIKIEITGVERHMFIDEKDVLELLHATGKVEGSQIASLNLREMERIVEKNPWVKNAEMYLDNNQVLQVQIEERQPVARVFTLAGNSFYLDSGAMRLPLSEKISARVPTFTGFPSDKQILAKPDSLLLNNIVVVGKYILADSFWMAQVAQIDITPQSNFEMLPVIGDHIVVLGSADDLDRKFKHLYTFYQQAWLQNGMNTYEKIDVQYTNQVVAIKKGTGKAQVDSARVQQLMDGLLPQVENNSTDSGYR
ncbi:MAG: FtsQ-type POTRA domain-containing protein, partial [Sediminibacterium sp.]